MLLWLILFIGVWLINIWLLIITEKNPLLSLINHTYFHRFLDSFLYGCSESPGSRLYASIHPACVISSPLRLQTQLVRFRAHIRLHVWSVTFCGSSAVYCGGVRCCGPAWGGWEQIGEEDSFKKKRLQILFSVRRWNARGRGSLCARGFFLQSFLASRGYFMAFNYFYTKQDHKRLKKKKKKEKESYITSILQSPSNYLFLK